MKEVSLSRHNPELWDLHRKAQKDLVRHNERLKEALKDNLFDLITGSDIIGKDPLNKRLIRVPRRFLELPRFRFREDKQEYVGQGQGDSKVGDVIAKQPKEIKRLRGQGGTEPGEDFYDIELDMQTIMQWICPDFKLPNLKPRRRDTLQIPNPVFDDVRKKKSFSNLDKKRTFLEAMKRQAILTGKATPVKITDEDLRVRTWNIEGKRDNNAVIFLIGDRSGSIGQDRLSLQKVFFWWTANAIRHHYGSATIKYITFHTEAAERQEKDFWTLGSSGGTRLASPVALVREILKKDFAPKDWNIYVCLASDGDGQGDKDNQEATTIIKEMIEADINLFGYLEHRNSAGVSSSFWVYLEQMLADKKGRQLAMHSASSLEGIKEAIREMFKE